jgi:2-phosphoglycerate kinase
MKKYIIMIGGLAGVGKTTVGNLITKKMNIDHHLGLGWIREALCSVLDDSEFPELFHHTFEVTNNNQTPFHNLYKQSIYMAPAIEKCIDRAFREGTSLLIHGGFVPGSFKSKNVDFICALKAPDVDKHRLMINSNMHAKRVLNENDLQNNRSIEKEFLMRCKKHNVSIVENLELEKTSDYIIEKILSKGD